MKIFKNIKPEFSDERGGITVLLPGDNIPIKSVLLITSKAGSVRSNHYHKADSHYCYILSGKAEWHEKPINGGESESAVLGPGDMIYTQPMIVHAVKFLEDTVFLAFSAQSRSQDAYEEDTIREELI